MIDERFFYLAALLNTISCVVYLYTTLLGKTKPNRVSWFLWAITPFLAFFAQIQQGVGIAALLTFSAGVGPLLVFIGSFFNKRAAWKITFFDSWCGLFAVVGLILWFVTKIGDIAIIFCILADTLAALPTIVKAYKKPKTENAFSFLIGAIAALIALLTIKVGTFAYYGFPLYLLLVNVLIFILIEFKLGKYFKTKLK